uniref:Poly A polymerase head domain-containing protein n=1 Tax=viral metagenome TaxID=1070528 RepID=A0A6C0DAU4_9ZZZZ
MDLVIPAVPDVDSAPDVLNMENKETENDEEWDKDMVLQPKPLTFTELLKTKNVSHIKWLLIRSIMDRLINLDNAIIFGGAVRDMILHNHAAKKFYLLSTEYNDPTVHPELNDRFLVPNDIDFFIRKGDFDRFKRYLWKKGFHYKEETIVDLSYVNLDIDYGYYMLYRAEILYYDQLNNSVYTIKLDAIVCDISYNTDINIPIMGTDFNVNKLKYVKDGIYSIDSRWTYEEIENHILTKQAYCNSTISDKRYVKMMEKGWKITMNYCTFVFKLRTNKEEENCVICLKTLEVGELEITNKQCNCKYSYCEECLPFSLKSDHCLMCKKDMCNCRKKCDIEAYNKYKFLDKD